MNKETAINILIEKLETKGFPKESIYTKNSDWNKKIELSNEKILSELNNFDLFIIDGKGNLCECYVVTKDEFKDFESIKNTSNEIGIEVFSVEYYGDDDEYDGIYIKSISNKEKFTVGIYLLIIELLTNIQQSQYFYRGHSSTRYNLIPGIYRESTAHNKKHLYVEKELSLFKTAIKDSPQDFPDSMNNFEKLVKMQHYGMPTRLLDITQSSLIALYFAVEKESHDGEVLIFELKKNDRLYYDDKKVVQMSRKYDSYENDENKVPKMNDTVLVVQPKLNNERIRVQGGLFFYFGEDESGNCSKFPFFPRRIIIPRKKKSELKKELKKLMIDESTVYQDLEHKMKKIKTEFLNLV